ncbi:MAG: 50S ribosomal protein L18 [Phycisphaeraceae bacterium]
MDKNRHKRIRWRRRKTGLRKRIMGTPERPRLTVYRSLKHMYAQIVDDLGGRTLTCASTEEAKLDKGNNVDAAKAVGQRLAEKAKAAGIEQVAFDRNGFKYHGRVKALADAAREAGLNF